MDLTIVNSPEKNIKVMRLKEMKWEIYVAYIG
jgi:hypothetical protein